MDDSILCERCRKFFPVQDVKYMPRGKGSMIALCFKCRQAAKPAPSPKTAKPLRAGKLPYFCSRCSYSFQFDPAGVTNLKCPYCGRADKLSQRSTALLRGV